MKGDTKNEDLVAEKITQDINQHFSGRYKIIWNDTLNHFLVDFDIICVLKNHIGYNYWSDVPIDQKELCYRGYNGKNTLLDWNVKKGILKICSIKKSTDHVLVLDLFNQDRY